MVYTPISIEHRKRSYNTSQSYAQVTTRHLTWTNYDFAKYWLCRNKGNLRWQEDRNVLESCSHTLSTASVCTVWPPNVCTCINASSKTGPSNRVKLNFEQLVKLDSTAAWFEHEQRKDSNANTYDFNATPAIKWSWYQWYDPGSSTSPTGTWANESVRSS